ncbi:MAG: hypothetical protein H8D23_11645 [Candidatus Brocadiales bacterium]|nr:hypothetical protein [Candidatus Brocadiales bacterium]
MNEIILKAKELINAIKIRRAISYDRLANELEHLINVTWMPTILRPEVCNGIRATLVGGKFDGEKCYVLDVEYLIRDKEDRDKFHYYKSFGELRPDFSETFEFQGITDRMRTYLDKK